VGLVSVLHLMFISVVCGVSAQVQNVLQHKTKPHMGYHSSANPYSPYKCVFSNISHQYQKRAQLLKSDPHDIVFFILLSENDLYFQVNILNALSLIMVFNLRSGYSETFIWIQ